jgi:hypothetical protein
MNLVIIPREFPQFGKSLHSIARRAESVFGPIGGATVDNATCGSAKVVEGKTGCGSVCECGGARGCGGERKTNFGGGTLAGTEDQLVHESWRPMAFAGLSSANLAKYDWPPLAGWPGGERPLDAWTLATLPKTCEEKSALSKEQQSPRICDNSPCDSGRALPPGPFSREYCVPKWKACPPGQAPGFGGTLSGGPDVGCQPMPPGDWAKDVCGRQGLCHYEFDFTAGCACVEYNPPYGPGSAPPGVPAGPPAGGAAGPPTLPPYLKGSDPRPPLERLEHCVQCGAFGGGWSWDDPNGGSVRRY